MAFDNILSAWQHALGEDGQRLYLEIPKQGGEQFLRYRLSSFYNRVLKHYLAFSEELKLSKGDLVGVFVDDPNDFALISHGLLVGGMVPVLIPSDLSDDLVVALLNNSNAKAVIFPIEFSARLAGMFSRTFSVEHWVVTGNAKVFGKSEVRRLDELLLATAGSGAEIDKAPSSEDLGLVVLTSGTVKQVRGVSFSQGHLVHIAQAVSRIVTQSEFPFPRCLALIPQKSIEGLAHALLAPLLTNVVGFLDWNVELNTFWDYITANDIKFVVLTLEQLRAINKRGKTRLWRCPPGVKFIVYTKGVLSSELIATFEKRFLAPTITVYSQTESGGLISALPRSLSAEESSRWLYDYSVPSSGVPLPNVDVKIVDLSGRELGEEQEGEILVKSYASMQGYTGTQPGEVVFGHDAYLHTGDEGYFIKGEDSEKHIFVTGRLNELIMRNNEKINPSKIDVVLNDLRGIEFGRAVGFANAYTGHEVGVYVVLYRAANIDDKVIINHLRDHLEWSECPKVVIFGERAPSGVYPSRAELAEQFSRYYNFDFSRGTIADL